VLTDRVLSDGVISLRCLNPEDAGERYLAWLHDPEVNRYLEVRHALPANVAELRSFVRGINASADSILFGIFGPSGQHLGNIKIGPINATHRRAEVGIVCGDRLQWGKGYASRAIRLASAHAFDSLGLLRLTAGCYEANAGSIGAFRKAGYEIEGRMAGYWDSEGERVAQMLMGCTKATRPSTPKTLKFGSVGAVIFIGGGQLMLDTLLAARTKGFRVGAVLAVRHASELLATGDSMRDALHRHAVPCLVAADAVDVYPANLGPGFADSLALCFGPAWVFPPKVLDRFPHGMLNFNGIPIPHYLGGAHYTWQILNRHRRGGCHIQRITDKVDRGELLMSESFDLPDSCATPQDYFRENERRGRDFLARFLDRLAAQDCFQAHPFAEVDERRLYFPRLVTVKNGWIDWNWSGPVIQDFCCAFGAPYPGASTFYNGRRLHLLRTTLLEGGDPLYLHPFCSGLVVRTQPQAFFVGVSSGLLRVDEWRFEGDAAPPRVREGDRLHTDARTLEAARLYRPRLGGTG
jgi:RimJ/RimL family protein N-acetyltransferase/methionyl-tRNA formyltransferase